jgi:hypothetical protein
VLALMERWFVYPEAALPSIARQRMMGWMSASFDDSSSPWIAATALQKQSAGTPITYYKKTLPDQWPDPNAYWIWSRNTSGGVMPASTCYFRKSFTLAQDTWVRLYVTCDNAERTILDGEVVVDNLNADPGTIGWSSAQTVERKLTAGTHQLSVEGVNETLPGGFSGPAALLLTMVEITPDGAVVSPLNVIVHTDATWRALDYPAAPPGMTVGQIVRIFVEEAQAEGVLTQISLGFTDTDDSHGAPWTELTPQAFDVGKNYLGVLQQLGEAFADYEMTHDLELRLYEWNTMGADLTGTVSLAIGADIEELDAPNEEDGAVTHRTNVLLVRDQTGTLYQIEDTTSTATYEKKGGYTELGTAPDEETAISIARGLMRTSGYPTLQLTGKVTETSGIYSTWERSDRIKLPNMKRVATESKILSIQFDQDDAGNPIFTIIPSQFVA